MYRPADQLLRADSINPGLPDGASVTRLIFDGIRTSHDLGSAGPRGKIGTRGEFSTWGSGLTSGCGGSGVSTGSGFGGMGLGWGPAAGGA
jgi:hypothetical protein